MSQHLTQDQISKWIMGQAIPDEEQHGLECPQCSAELKRFRERISTFRLAMQEWSEREVVPRLESIPPATYKPQMAQPTMRWALLAITFAVLVGIPIYQHRNIPESVTESAANSTMDDVLLMESVNAHLSRPIPMPMERVMALLPTEVEQPGSPAGSHESFERKETR